MQTHVGSHLSQDLTVHPVAHGLICTSILRLTLKSKKTIGIHIFILKWWFSSSFPSWFHFVLCGWVRLTTLPHPFLSLSPDLRPTVEPCCKRYVFLQQHTAGGVKAVHFSALSVTKAPHKPRGTKLSVHIKLTWHITQNTLLDHKNKALSAYEAYQI